MTSIRCEKKIPGLVLSMPNQLNSLQNNNPCYSQLNTQYKFYNKCLVYLHIYIVVFLLLTWCIYHIKKNYQRISSDFKKLKHVMMHLIIKSLWVVHRFMSSLTILKKGMEELIVTQAFRKDSFSKTDHHNVVLLYKKTAESLFVSY